MLATTFLCLCLYTTFTDGAKILGVFMVPSYSHQIVFQPIWKELSLRGHQVTVYTPFPLNDTSLTNLTEYDLGFSYKVFKSVTNFGESKVDNGDLANIMSMFYRAAESQLEHTYLKDLIRNIKNETYDLIMVEFLWQTYYALQDIYKCPMVGITSLPLSPFGSNLMGFEKHPVTDPDMFLPFSITRSFKERAMSWAHNWLCRYRYFAKMLPRYNGQIKKHFGKDLDAYELAKKFSLVIGNSNFALEHATPIGPSYIPVSALHVGPRKPLPADLEEYLGNLKNDVIYFSFGTNVNSSKVAKDIISAILKVLGRLPYTILWKYENDEPPENLPKNFLIRKWFPQQDILGHPKVKLFITQGGIQSIDEAVSRKVPMLVVSFLGDQHFNADKCVSLGIAEKILFLDLTEEEFENKINKLLTNTTYKKNIEKQSLIMNDQPMNSVDTAVYWIEYVIRHNGAPHLRYPALDLPFYQYYLLDIYLCIALVIYVLYHIFKRIPKVLAFAYSVLKMFYRTRNLFPSKSKKE